MKFTFRKLKFKDVFKMARLYKKMDLNADLKAVDMAHKTTEELKYIAFDLLFSKSGEVEQEVYEFISDILGISTKEVGEIDLDQFEHIWTELSSINNIPSFLKQAVNLAKTT